jgi:carboxyl-terminal processing protease
MLRRAILWAALVLVASAPVFAQLQIAGVAPAGIGAVLLTHNGAPVINEVIPHSPAADAGLKPQDTIVWVDYRDVAGMKLEDVVSLIRGEAGSTVAITVLHPGDSKPHTYTMTRRPIVIGGP